MLSSLAEPTPNLTVTIFNYAMSPYPDWQRQAWGASLLITGGVLALTLLTRYTWECARHEEPDGFLELSYCAAAFDEAETAEAKVRPLRGSQTYCGPGEFSFTATTSPVRQSPGNRPKPGDRHHRALRCGKSTHIRIYNRIYELTVISGPPAKCCWTAKISWTRLTTSWNCAARWG